MNGLWDGLNVIVLPALEKKVPGKCHSESGMGSSPYSVSSGSYFKVWLTNLNRFLTLHRCCCQGGSPEHLSALWGYLGISLSLSTFVKSSSSSANELTCRCNLTAPDPTTTKNTEDLKLEDNDCARGTGTTRVKNDVFKTLGSCTWLSEGLTHLCSYFQPWLQVYKKYLDQDEELFVHVRLSKRTFELTASYWRWMSFMLELGFLLGSC